MDWLFIDSSLVSSLFIPGVSDAQVIEYVSASERVFTCSSQTCVVVLDILSAPYGSGPVNRKDIAERASLTYLWRPHFRSKKALCAGFPLVVDGHPKCVFSQLTTCFEGFFIRELVLQAASSKRSLVRANMPRYM